MPETYTGEPSPIVLPVPTVAAPVYEDAQPQAPVQQESYAEPVATTPSPAVNPDEAAPPQQTRQPAFKIEDFAQLFEHEKFKAMPYEQRASKVEEALALAKDDIMQEPDYGPEAHRLFGKFAAKQREKLAATESWGEKTKSAVKGVGEGLKSLAMGAAGAAADLSFLNMDGSMRVPLSTVGPLMTQKVEKAASAADYYIDAATLGKEGRAIEYTLEKLKSDLEEGHFEFTPDGIGKLLSKYQDDLSPKQQAFYKALYATGEQAKTWADENSIIAERNTALLARFVKTHDPKAWDQFRSNILQTPQAAAANKESERIIGSSDTVKALDATLGKGGGSEAVQAAADPVNLAAMAFPASRMFKPGGAIKNAAIGGLEAQALGQIGLSIENPSATAGDRLETAKAMLAMSLGMSAGGHLAKVGMDKVTARPETANYTQFSAELPVNNEIPSQVTNPAEIAPTVTASTQATPSLPEQLALRRADPEGYQRMQEAYNADPASVPQPFVDALGLNQPQELPQSAPTTPPVNVSPPPVSPVAESSPSNSTAMNNAAMNERRAAMGMPPLDASEVRQHAEIIAEADALIQNPNYAPVRLDELLANDQLGYSDTDTLVMQRYEQQLSQRAAAGDAAAVAELLRIGNLNKRRGKKWSDEGRARQIELRSEIPPLSDLLDEAKTAAENKGELLTPERVKEITDTHAQMEEWARKTKEGTDAIAKLEAEAKARMEQGAQVSPVLSVALEVRAAKAPRKTAGSKKIASMFEKAKTDASTLKKEAVDWADKIIADRNKVIDPEGPFVARSGLDQELVAAYSIKLAELIAKGVKTVAEATAEMVKMFGQKFVDQMEAQAAFESSPAGIVDKAKATVDPSAPIDRTVAREVAKAHVSEAMDEGRTLGEDELTHLVQTSLEPIYGETLKTSDVREAWANYGNPKPPTVDALKAHFAELRSRALIQAQIDRINAKLPVLKTGQQTKAKSVEVRTLIEERNRLMKEAGIQPKDPAKELASRRTRVISALRNEREKLQAIIDGKLERVTPDKAPFKDDAEIAGLRAEVEYLRKREAEMRSEDPTIAADTRARITAERGAEAYNRKIKLGTLPEKKTPATYSAATKQAIDAHAQARKAYQDLINSHPQTLAKRARERAVELQNEESALDLRIQEEEMKLAGRATAMPPKPEQAGPPMFADKLKRLKDLKEAARNLKNYYANLFKNTANIKNESRLAAENRLIDYHVKRAALSDFTQKTAKPFEYNDAVHAAIEARKQAKAAYEALRDADPATQAEREAYAIQELDRSITKARQDLQTALAGTDPTKPHQPRPPVAAAIKARLDELTAIRKLTQQTVNEMPANRRTKKLKLLDSAIAREEAWLAGKRRNPSPLFPVLMDTELQARQDYLKTLRDQRASTAEELANKTERINNNRAKQLSKQSEELRAQIKEIEAGKMPEAKKKIEKEYGEKVGKLLVERNILMQKKADAIFQLERKNMTGLQKTLDIVKEASSFVRALVTSPDLSGVLNQGSFNFFSSPLISAKGYIPMIKSFWSEEYYAAKMNELLKTEGAIKFLEGGGFLSDADTNIIKSQEENYTGRWARKIPGVQNSNRAMSAYLNILKANLMEHSLANHTKMIDGMRKRVEMDIKELKAEAASIDMTSGRGKLWKEKSGEAIEWLNTLAFSLRFTASQLQTVTGYPILKAQYHGNFQLRNRLIKKYVSFVAGYAAYTAFKSALSDKPGEIEYDPRSTNFLKTKTNNTTSSADGGLMTMAVFLARLATGETKDSKGKIQPLRNFARLSDVTSQFTGAKPLGDVPGSPYAPSVGKLVGKFVEGRLAPTPSWMYHSLIGQDFLGNQTNPIKEAQKSVIPMSISGLAETTMDVKPLPQKILQLIEQIHGGRATTIDPKQKEKSKKSQGPIIDKAKEAYSFFTR